MGCRPVTVVIMYVHKYEDMKSRSAIATACHLFALPSSTLLVKCSSTTRSVGYRILFSR